MLRRLLLCCATLLCATLVVATPPGGGKVTVDVGAHKWIAAWAADLGCPCASAALRASTAAKLNVVAATDANADACKPYAAGAFKGQIALVRRGTCDFVVKVVNAAQAGAVGVIIRNNVSAAFAWQLGPKRAGAMGVPAMVMGASDADALAKAAANHSGNASLAVSGCPWGLSNNASQVLITLTGILTVIVATWLSSAADRGVGDERGAGEYEAIPGLADDDLIGELDWKDAVGFMVMASGMLLVLFFFMKQAIMVVICLYTFGATNSLASLLATAVRTLRPARSWAKGHWSLRDTAIAEFGYVTHLAAWCYPFALAITVWWFVTRHDVGSWWQQDLMSFALSVHILGMVRIQSAKVAAYLLSLMFVYDIFWVFISPLLFGGKSVMVAVATGDGADNESLPMLFAMPHNCGFSLLGLGDIVVPSLLISLALRMDCAKGLTGAQLWGFGSYWAPCILGYAVGLAGANVAVRLMAMGQPALLYIVPCTLGPTLLLAKLRGEFAGVWDGSILVRQTLPRVQ